MTEQTKLSDGVSQDEDKSFRAGLYIGGFSVAALLWGLFLVFLYSHSAHCHPTPTRVQPVELESGSFAFALAALQDGAVIRREGDFYGKYRLENRAIVRFFDDEEPDHGYEKNSFRVDEILADDWVVEPKR